MHRAKSLPNSCSRCAMLLVIVSSAAVSVKNWLSGRSHPHLPQVPWHDRVVEVRRSRLRWKIPQPRLPAHEARAVHQVLRRSGKLEFVKVPVHFHLHRVHRRAVQDPLHRCARIPVIVDRRAPQVGRQLERCRRPDGRSRHRLDRKRRVDEHRRRVLHRRHESDLAAPSVIAWPGVSPCAAAN